MSDIYKELWEQGPKECQAEIERLRSIILSGVDCNACRGHGWQEGGSHPVTGAIEQLMCDVCNGLGRVPWTDNHGPKTEHQTDLEYAWEQIAIYENEDNTEIDRLRAENDRLRNELETIKVQKTQYWNLCCQRLDSLREVAQMIIEEIGSVGPENADEAAKRAVKEIQRLRSQCNQQASEIERLHRVADELRSVIGDIIDQLRGELYVEQTLHPNGHCGCAGEGTCQWCLMIQVKEERDELRSLLEECKPYLSEGSRLTPTPRRKEEIERWTAAIDLLKRIEEK